MPDFRLVSRTGIGLAVPPSCVGGLSPSSLPAARPDRRLCRRLADPAGDGGSPALHLPSNLAPKHMIILFHPRAVKPKNRRFPLRQSLSIAAALEGKEDYVIVDGNLDTDP